MSDDVTIRIGNATISDDGDERVVSTMLRVFLSDVSRSSWEAGIQITATDYLTTISGALNYADVRALHDALGAMLKVQL